MRLAAGLLPAPAIGTLNDVNMVHCCIQFWLVISFHVTALRVVLCAGPKEQFPIFEDRIATQHLVYLRLARLQNPAQLAKASRCADVGQCTLLGLGN